MRRGINQNYGPENIPKENIFWGKNGVSSEKIDADINELGTAIEFDVTNITLPTSLKADLGIAFFIGQFSISNLIVLCYKDTTNHDCIIVLDENTFAVVNILKRTDFGFLQTNPLKIRGKFNALGQLNLVLTDGVGFVKYVNMSTASSTDALKLYNLFPLSFDPEIKISTIENAGNLKSGAYYVAIQYLTVDRNRSDYSHASSPYFVTGYNRTTLGTVQLGDVGGITTSKAMKISLTDLDPSYSKICIGIITHQQGVIKAYAAKEVSYKGTTLNTVLTGNEFLNDLLLEEIIVKSPQYTSAGAICDLNDELLLADLTTDEEIDYQIAANQVKLKYTSVLDAVDPITATIDRNSRTFMPDEVYAFYIQFELMNGKWTRGFHIPGPALTSIDLGNSVAASSYSGGLKFGGATPKVFQVEDTSSQTTGALTDPDTGLGYNWGSFGKWQQTNEVYPDDFPLDYTDYLNPIVLAGTPVRHHKFPSRPKLESKFYSGIGYGQTVLDFLGVIAENINCNPNYYSQNPIGRAAAPTSPPFRGYRIGYAVRSLGEESVIGTTLLQHGATTPHYSGSIASNSGNWNKNSQNGDANYKSTINVKYARLNAFDTLLDKPAIGDTYLSQQWRYNAGSMGLVSGLEIYGRLATSVLNGTDLYAFGLDITKRLNPTPLCVQSAVSDSEKYRKLSTVRYVPQNVKFAESEVVIDNLYAEDVIFATIEGTPLTYSAFAQLEDHDSNPSTALKEEIFLSTIKVPKTDFFLGYKEQNLAMIGHVQRNRLATGATDHPDTLGIGPRYVALFGGDAFLGTHSFVALSPRVGDVLLATNGTRVFRYFPCVCWNNPNQRIQIDGDYSTYFYPAFGKAPAPDSAGLWTSFWDSNKPYNVLKYSKDFSAISNIENTEIFDPNTPDVTDYPYRIIKSLAAGSETTLSDGWKSFKNNSYYELIRNKGKIINLENWANDNLLIHLERALLKTRDTGVLETGGPNVTLGSGELFDIRPKEESSTSYGVAGTQHKFSCLLCDLGYFFVDASRGQVFLYDGDNCNNLTQGLRLFFRDNLLNVADNPFNGTGLTVAYDVDNNRLLLSQKANKSWTVSYSTIKKEWSYAHDYIPDLFFNTRYKVYSLKNNQVHTHNIGPRGTYYGTVYPFYVDVVLNDIPDTEKLLETVSFLTRYRNADGSVNQRKTITHITIWNDQHCTDRIPIVTNDTDSLFVDGVNTKMVDESWSFNQIYNMVTDPNSAFISDVFSDYRPISSNFDSMPVWWSAEPLRGKFFIVRLEFSNVDDVEFSIRECEGQLKTSQN